ncbi:Bro-N domain-containing protein [Candidatus Saccharibacteria bacterium]|nr:Bro-N domain-containing protein [Candidatus Saccharibacteria bacterium]
MPKDKLQLFQNQPVRSVWDEENEKWWFSVVDVVAILTDAKDRLTGRKYWNKLKQRLAEEGNETVTNCHQLKMTAEDGKKRLTDVADTEQVFRLIQSIPSKKAEPFKLWLAKVGSQFIDEAVDPEIAIQRGINNYRQMGYSEAWIVQRVQTIKARKALTDEWDKSGVKQGKEYAMLTDAMYKTWSGMTTRDYKKFKGLKKENLRDNMTNAELVLNMLAEVTAADISVDEKPKDFNESAAIAQTGAEVAHGARRLYEKRTGKPAVSRLNAKDLGQRKLPS